LLYMYCVVLDRSLFLVVCLEKIEENHDVCAMCDKRTNVEHTHLHSPDDKQPDDIRPPPSQPPALPTHRMYAVCQPHPSPSPRKTSNLRDLRTSWSRRYGKLARLCCTTGATESGYQRPSPSASQIHFHGSRPKSKCPLYPPPMPPPLQPET
jgi:hypothetical protein